MQFKDLIGEVKKLKVDEVRVDSSVFFEAVVAKDEIKMFTSLLEKFFGPPSWPSNSPLSPEIQDHINGYGGVMPGQTLYSRNSGNNMVIAMLWPWGNGLRTTIKIINCQEGGNRK